MKLSLEDSLYYEAIFEVVKKPNKYILILYKYTYNETSVDVFDTEIEALQTAKNVQRKIELY